MEQTSIGITNHDGNDSGSIKSFKRASISTSTNDDPTFWVPPMQQRQLIGDIITTSGG